MSKCGATDNERGYSKRQIERLVRSAKDQM